MSFNGNQSYDHLNYLDEVNNWHLFAMDILRQMGDIYGDTSKLRETEDILKTSKTYIDMFFNFTSVAFYLINEDDADFVFAKSYPQADKEKIKADVERLIDDGRFSWAINQNRAVIYELSKDEAVVARVIASKTRMRGMFIGYLSAVDARKLSEGPVNLLSVVLHNTGYALESAALYEIVQRKNEELERKVEARTRDLQYQFKHDALTGLPNRVLFIERIQQAIDRLKDRKSKAMLVIILIDLDMFKAVNDTLGHDVGDKLLVKAAGRFEGALRRYDVDRQSTQSILSTLARIGGDEFALLVSDIYAIDELLPVIHQLQHLNTKSVVINKEELMVTSSIGISIYPNDGDEPQSLLKKADAAMYHAKSEGRSNYQFYSEKINVISSAYIQLSAKLHQATAEKKFHLYYQPKVDIKEHKIVGFEALLRWFDTDGVSIPPDTFIPVAEDIGLIVEIGRWVIREACQMAATLKQHGYDLHIAVNLSAKQFRDAGLIDFILTEIEDAGISTANIELEITEGVIIENITKTLEILAIAKKASLAVAIDDFGTGYSSLSYLKQFKIDCLKIDRSFVRDLATDPDDEAIVNAVVALAHSLSMTVVAEGVETEEQLNFLKGISCDIVQGYYYSKAMSGAEVLPFLDAFGDSKEEQ